MAGCVRGSTLAGTNGLLRWRVEIVGASLLAGGREYTGNLRTFDQFCSEPKPALKNSILIHSFADGHLDCLHNGILRSREKEGAYTLCDSMDGTGEHYAK